LQQSSASSASASSPLSKLPARPPPPIEKNGSTTTPPAIHPAPSPSNSTSVDDTVAAAAHSATPPDVPTASAAAPAEPPREPEVELTPEQKEAEKLAKRERIRTKVAFEIESTELSYVESLETLVKTFIEPLTAALPSEPIISKEDINNLFSNIASIAVLNRKFLTDLSARLVGWSNSTTQIGDVFLGFCPFFKMYTTYVSNHDRATDLIKSLTKENKRFREFVAGVSAGGLSLASYLIMPIQRIPRYKLLIEELLRNTTDSHPDHPNLVKGLDLVSHVAKHINSEMHASENRQTILRIQGEFTHAVSFVSPSRRFIKQGALTKKCRSSDKVYEFFLFNDLLVYASKGIITQVTGPRFKVHQEIPIDAAFSITDVPTPAPSAKEREREREREKEREKEKEEKDGLDGDSPDPASQQQYLFQINSKIKSFIVYVYDFQTKQSWLEAFAKVLNEQAQIAKARSAGSAGSAGQASDETDPARSSAPSKNINETIAPVWRSDDSEDACPLCQKKFTFTKRRHHCRKCGGLCCNACSLKRMIIKSQKSSELRDPQRVCDRCVEEITLQQKQAAEHAAALARQAMGLPPDAPPGQQPTSTTTAPSSSTVAGSSSTASPPPGHPSPALLSAHLKKRLSSMALNPTHGAASTSTNHAGFNTAAAPADKANGSTTSDGAKGQFDVAALRPPPLLSQRTVVTFTTVGEDDVESDGEDIPPPTIPAPLPPNDNANTNNNNTNASDSPPATTSASSPPVAAPTRPLPRPPAAPRPSKLLVSVGRAMYDYTASTGAGVGGVDAQGGTLDLSLTCGELIHIMSKDESGWWIARNKNGQVGTVPSTYVEELSEKQVFDVSPASGQDKDASAPSPAPPQPAPAPPTHTATTAAASTTVEASASDSAPTPSVVASTSADASPPPPPTSTSSSSSAASASGSVPSLEPVPSTSTSTHTPTPTPTPASTTTASPPKATPAKAHAPTPTSAPALSPSVGGSNNGGSGGGSGACSECSCTAFTANPFKPTMCKECRHNKSQHA